MVRRTISSDERRELRRAAARPKRVGPRAYAVAMRSWPMLPWFRGLALFSHVVRLAENAQRIAAPEIGELIFFITRFDQALGDPGEGRDVFQPGDAAAAVPVGADADMLRPNQIE